MTGQEMFWTGEFGDEYTDRNLSKQAIASAKALFSSVFTRIQKIESVLELGSNCGMNLMAISELLPDVMMQAVEINEKAAKECEKIDRVSVYHGSMFDFPYTQETYDLSFTRGVLIHIAPERLKDAYEVLYRSSKRYILVAEYYNPSPVEIPYRGNEDKLFKRDFAGEMMDIYEDLELVDYGFVYHRDVSFPMDDVTWFLMEKKAK